MGDEYAVALERDGYLQVVDAESLMRLTSEHDLVVRLLRRPGDFVVSGEPAT